jgi:hypothetical protein
MHGYGIYERIMGVVKVQQQGIDKFIKHIGGGGREGTYSIPIYVHVCHNLCICV